MKLFVVSVKAGRSLAVLVVLLILLISGKLRQGPRSVLAGLHRLSETQRVLGTSSKPKQYETKWRPKAARALSTE